MSSKLLASIEPAQFLAIARDSRTYRTGECAGLAIVETWTAMMFDDPSQAPAEEVEAFTRYAAQEKNWHWYQEKACVLSYSVSGKAANGSVVFYRLTYLDEK